MHIRNRGIKNDPQEDDWPSAKQAVGTGGKWRHQSSRYELRPELSAKQTYNYVYEPLFMPGHYDYPSTWDQHRGVLL